MDTAKKIKIVECPRDAMQGWPHFIPTAKKIAYLNDLLKVGFDTLDVGSFVSPKAIPQMADTKDVLQGLQLQDSKTQLLTIVANKRGAEEAVIFDEISYLGFPFSISETFQQRNTNSTIAKSFELVAEIQNLCVKNKKELVIYISMGFGNPYGDPYNESIVFEWVHKMAALDIRIISLADTVGLASKEQVNIVTKYVIDSLPNVETGVHLHSTPHNREEKLFAALEAGCYRFDAAIKGIGGCPMAGDDLVGNMDTEVMIDFFTKEGFSIDVDIAMLKKCSSIASTIFV